MTFSASGCCLKDVAAFAFNDFQKVIYVLTTSLVRMNPYK